METERMNILMGVGNPIRGDDGVGIYVAKNLDSENWTSLDCGTVPESFTSVVRKKNPKILVIVDSAEMMLEPGDIRVIPKDRIDSLGFGTHSLPLSHLIDYLEPYAERIIFIGIQHKNIADTTEISEEVKKSAEKLIRIIKENKFDEILTLR